VQSAGYAVHERPLVDRLANAALACLAYLRQTFLPRNLAVFYPHPPSIPTSAALAAAISLIAVTAFCLFRVFQRATCNVQRARFGAQKSPTENAPTGNSQSLPPQQPSSSIFHLPSSIPVGWLWFLGMLVPVIGLIQVGVQSRADRYTYLPSIGLFIAIVWGAAEAFKVQSSKFKVQSSLGPLTQPTFPGPTPLPELSRITHHASRILPLVCLAALPPLTRSYLAYWANSEALFTHALKVTSPNPIALNHLGVALVMQDRFDEAKPCFEQALALDPKNTQASFNLATLLLRAGQVDEALELLRPALQGKAVISKGFAGVGMILGALGRPADAILFYRKALEADPDALETLNNLAWLLATTPDGAVRDGAEAVQLAERACALSHFRRPVFIGTLAAAYAEVGRFSDAIATAEKARALAHTQRDEAIARRNEELLQLYRQGQPYREPLQKEVK
jgi:Flp pilus assembly protein TadD